MKTIPKLLYPAHCQQQREGKQLGEITSCLTFWKALFAVHIPETQPFETMKVMNGILDRISFTCV